MVLTPVNAASPSLFFAAYHAYCPTTFVSGACMGRTSVFHGVNGFDAEILLSEDIDLWLRMALDRGVKFLDFPVLNYRTGEISLMNDVSQNDVKLISSYRLIQSKFKSSVGPVTAFVLKVISRIFFKLTNVLVFA